MNCDNSCVRLTRWRRHCSSAKRSSGTSEERFRALVQNSTDVTGITDKNGIILYRSPNLQTTLGYEVADTLGKSISDYLWPEDLPRAQSRLAELA